MKYEHSNLVSGTRQHIRSPRKILLFVLVLLGASMAYELATFSLNDYSSNYSLYPYVPNMPVWLIKHALIAVSLLVFMIALKKVDVASRNRPIIRKIKLISLILLGAIIFSIAEEVNKSAGSFFVGPNDDQTYAVLIIMVTYPIYLLASLLFISAVRFIYLHKSWYAYSSIISGLIIAVLLFNVLLTQSVLATIPLDQKTLRSKERTVNFDTPVQYGAYFDGREHKPFYDAAAKLTRDQWDKVCQRVRMASYGMDILGKKAAASCFYVGALVYEDPLMCESASDMEGICRADLAKILNNIEVCNGEIDCLSRNPQLLSQKGKSCESLKTDEDDQTPFYASKLSPYAECERRELQLRDSSRTWDANSYRLATTKLVVNEWYADPFDPSQSYIELKNVSGYKISLESVEFRAQSTVIPLSLHTLAPGEILLLHENDLSTYASQDVTAPLIKKGGIIMARTGDVAIGGGALYENIPSGYSIGVVDLKALREGRFYSDWEEIYQIMPQTPGRENQVMVQKRSN